jgi:hypothetical protein
MQFACRIRKVATNTHSDYIYLLLFHGNNGYANVSHYYIAHTLPALLYIPNVVTVRP